ncbi:hypothetical protein BD770DRAFT_444931 [Pilaira anomala]|nr:hypothetical protein BD770DRAFT_444931 [Pilaira anomala]
MNGTLGFECPDLSAVHAHERIARFHILSLHELCEYDEATFSLPQEMKQLHKTLISLMKFYDDLRDEGIEAENEAGFRAYHIINQIKDPNIIQKSIFLPIQIFRNPYMKRALEFHALSQILETGSELKNLFQTHFSEVRKGALKAMDASYMMKAGGVLAEDVRQILAYDTLDQLFKEVMMHGKE